MHSDNPFRSLHIFALFANPLRPLRLRSFTISTRGCQRFKSLARRAAAFAICFTFSSSSPFGATARPARTAHPNVILITIDTVRADHVGCYGAKNVETPTLDSLAHDGIVFERAISQVPLTWPSHTVILTGTYPFQNGVQDFTGTPLEPRFRSVAQAFKDHGYRTGAVVSSFVLDRSWGLARGFDFYDDAFSPEQFKNRDLGLVERPAGESVTRALTWLQKSSQRPFFFWLHLYDPHSPYSAPEPYPSRFRDRPYDGEIAYADHELGRLISWLKRSQLYDRSLIVMLSDHGESLGEHGEHEHGFFIYNSTVHIPFIVKPPAQNGVRPTRVSTPVETTAVPPLLLRMAGVSDDAMEKQLGSADSAKEVPLPVAKWINEEFARDTPAYSETFYPFSSFGWNPLHAVETSRYHFIDAPTPELYDLASDPDETTNVAAQQTATVAVLKSKLQEILRANPYQAQANSFTVAPDAAEKLRALGYVAYRSPVSPEALKAGLPDPKEKIEVFNTILDAQDAMRAGDTARGEALFSEIEQQDPNLYIVHFSLGEAAARNKDWERSAAEFQKCLELNRSFDQAMTGLSRAFYYLGKNEDARLWAQNALKYNSQNYKAWYELGRIDSRSDKSAAIADYEKAVAIQGNFAPLHRDLGMLYFQQQRYQEAAKHLARAVELGTDEPPLFNFLGICYDRTGRLTLAIESYHHAIKLDPSLAEAHLNLGYTYHRQGREKLAATEYERACELKQEFCRVTMR